MFYQSWDSGNDWDVVRFSNNASYCQPRQDTPGLLYGMTFGSAHANGLHMAFCDGSVTMINYTININVHHCLGNRKDGLTIDAKAY